MARSADSTLVIVVIVSVVIHSAAPQDVIPRPFNNCDENTPCPTGFICRTIASGNTCVRVEDLPCRTDADCDSTGSVPCFIAPGATVGFCGGCASDAGCPKDKSCMIRSYRAALYIAYGRCVECEDDKDCGSDQYCNSAQLGRFVPGVVRGPPLRDFVPPAQRQKRQVTEPFLRDTLLPTFTCRPLLQEGGRCRRNGECESGSCGPSSNSEFSEFSYVYGPRVCA